MNRRHLSASAAVLLPALLAMLAAGPVTVAAADPSEPGRERGSIGSWSVTAAGAGSWQLAWTAPEPLPVVDDRPRFIAAEDLGAVPAGAEVAPATIGEDGRTVRATLVGQDEPDPQDLDVVLSGRVLDEVVEAPDTVPGKALLTTPGQTLLGADPGVPGDVPIEVDDYALEPVHLDGMPQDVEMVGHVVQPAGGAADPDDPLVLFLHGRHDSCYDPDTGLTSTVWPCGENEEPVPSHLGYDYVQRLLASHGYVTVSIAANGINAQDSVPDFGTAARSQLVQAHLDQWAQWASEGRPVDLADVILVGHSRGGEGVSRASLEIPLDAPYQVRGQVLVAPTNVAMQTSPYVPTATLLPDCDGDIFWHEGQFFADRSRDLSLDDDSLKSSVLLMGANHNFFNTEWTPGMSAAPSTDDWGDDPGACEMGAPSRLSAEEQQAAGKAYIAGAVRLFAADETEFLPMYDGSPVRVPSAEDAVVLSHALGGGRDVRRPGIDATPTQDATAATRLCEGRTPYENAGTMCGRYAAQPAITPHWPGSDDALPTVEAFQMQWQAAGAVGGLDLAEPLDLSASRALDIRTIVDPRRGDVELEVRVTDTYGATAQVAALGGPTLPALPRRSEFHGGRYWAQTLRVDPADLTGVDLARIGRVELVGLGGDGRVWVLDLASVPADLPEAGLRRAPLVDLGEVEVAEGPRGTHVANLPFDVLGELTEDAQLQLWRTPGFDELPGEPRTVDVPAGSDGGTIAWEYRGNDRDSRHRIEHELVVFAIEGVMVRDHLGRVTVVDDDPSPRTRFRVAETAVREGGATTWTVRLKEPSRRGMLINLEALEGDGTTTPVRVDDIGKRWVRSYAFFPPGTNPPLHETTIGVWQHISTDQPTLVFRIPVRDDDRTERRETITLRAVSDTGWRSRPLTVVVRD